MFHATRTKSELQEQVRTHCRKLKRAVEMIMDPNCSQQHRSEALQMCEGFKQECPFCVACGLKLAEKSQPDIARHFGLQLLEHVAKYRWKFLFPHEKKELKSSIMELLFKGTKDISEEQGHIKGALARAVVELIKLDWPQGWPDMLLDLEILSKKGETQTELVMIVLLRLAEDLVINQSLPAELMYLKKTMMKEMGHILRFIGSVLRDIVKKYKCSAKQSCRVGVATLNALAGYLDWVMMSYITECKCELLEMLCFFLDKPELQLEAADCLCILLNRTGKVEERKPMLFLFEDVPLNYILISIEKENGKRLLNEKSYWILKKLSTIICGLANLLCMVVGADDDVEIPGNFQKYLDSLLKFTTHYSLFLRSSTQGTWKAFLKHKIFSSDTVLLSKFPKYLQATTVNLLKVGFPSKNDSPSCEYSRFDFDNDEDFLEFFKSFCAQQGEVIKVACQLAPRTCFRMASEWLKSLMAGTAHTVASISQSSPALQWDAVTFFFECVLQKITEVMKKEDIPVNDCVNLLQHLLNFSAKDPLILSCVLTNMQTLFPFLTHSPECLFEILTKLFGIVEKNKGPRPNAVKNARRHACACIKEICQSHAELVLPNLEILFNQVKQMLGNELMLTPMEKSTLMEALISVSNELKDHDAQREFLEELMAPVVSIWLSSGMQKVLSNPEEFLHYVGANSHGSDTDKGGLASLNRLRISFCVSTVLGVLKQARWPSDIEEAKAGGFVSGIMPNGKPIYNNPCSPQILKLLDSILLLISTQHNIHLPDFLSKMLYPFAKALYRLEVTASAPDVSQALHFVSSTPTFKAEHLSVQDFFYTLYSNCFKILGHACVYIMKDFYAIEDLAARLLKYVFVNMENIPDYKLTLMIRVFMKPLVLFCPIEDHQSLLSPVLGPFLTSLHVRLSNKWHLIDQRIQENEDCIADENPESPEFQAEKQVRILTRDVMDFIIAFSVCKKGADVSILDENYDDDDDNAMEVQTPQPSKNENVQLSELGVLLMQEEDICSAMLITVFTSLAWNDSVTAQRTAIQLCWPLLKQMLPGTLFVNAVKYFFTMVLKGLQVHSDYYFCRIDLIHLGYQIYSTLRPSYIELKNIMEDVPDIDKNLLESFDKELSVTPQSEKEEEAREDKFKRLLKGCIGKRL
ncbi:exportin-5-like [Ambystoma mexicanum]|uniref:exportin-5-like n=1 Tax=Ambystoma mexicanum TaxID=8296 RepID=UPI0037E794C8